jgi:hypothetical protein
MNVSGIIIDLLGYVPRHSFTDAQLESLTHLDIPDLRLQAEPFLDPDSLVTSHGICCTYGNREICTVYGNKVVPNLRYIFNKEIRGVVGNIEDCCMD